MDFSVEENFVGKGLRNVATGEVPLYSEMIATIFDRLGWNPDRFRVHRLRWHYPIPSVMVTRWFRLPPRK